jgi:hypothetical protein
MGQYKQNKINYYHKTEGNTVVFTRHGRTIHGIGAHTHLKWAGGTFSGVSGKQQSHNEVVIYPPIHTLKPVIVGRLLFFLVLSSRVANVVAGLSSTKILTRHGLVGHLGRIGKVIEARGVAGKVGTLLAAMYEADVMGTKTERAERTHHGNQGG